MFFSSENVEQVTREGGVLRKQLKAFIPFLNYFLKRQQPQ